jgi:hypothetical protein
MWPSVSLGNRAFLFVGRADKTIFLEADRKKISEEEQ